MQRVALALLLSTSNVYAGEWQTNREASAFDVGPVLAFVDHDGARLEVMCVGDVPYAAFVMPSGAPPVPPYSRLMLRIDENTPIDRRARVDFVSGRQVVVGDLFWKTKEFIGAKDKVAVAVVSEGMVLSEIHFPVAGIASTVAAATAACR